MSLPWNPFSLTTQSRKFYLKLSGVFFLGSCGSPHCARFCAILNHAILFIYLFIFLCSSVLREGRKLFVLPTMFIDEVKTRATRCAKVSIFFLIGVTQPHFLETFSFLLCCYDELHLRWQEAFLSTTLQVRLWPCPHRLSPRQMSRVKRKIPHKPMQVHCH